MTFNEAKAKFAELAGDRYRSMYYTLCDHGNGDAPVQLVHLYVDVDNGIGTSGYGTWEEALSEIANRLHLERVVPISLAPPTDDLIAEKKPTTENGND